MTRILRTLIAVIVPVAMAAAALVLSAPASATATSNRLAAGHVLSTGQSLRSADGAYTATVTAFGRLLVRHGSRILWATPTKGPHARLVLRPHGNLALMSGSRQLWVTNTAGSGAAALVLANDGSLTLRSSGGTVWSYQLGNACGGGSGPRVMVNLTNQFARLCDGNQQVLTTPITSGASAVGDGTPTGTWRLQAKIRDTYLYPAEGGAYFVHYWMPYDGAYGMHDSSWQDFPYGSPLYRTRGSHGCVHFPAAAISWMFAWAPIGTIVSIHA